MSNPHASNRTAMTIVAIAALVAGAATAAPPLRYEPRIPSVPFETPETTWLFAIADLDGDAVPDRVQGGSGDWYVFWGRPDGTFEPGPTVPAPLGYAAVRFFDVDGDGRADRVTASQDVSSPARIEVARGRGDGSFEPPVANTFGTGAVGRLGPIDIDADGDTDLRVEIVHMECSDWECWGVPETYLLAGDATGVFVDVSGALPWDLGFDAAFFTDVNADGRVDAVGGGSSMEIFLGDGNGGFSAPIPNSNVLTAPFAAGDVDGDGHVDLVGDAWGRGATALGRGDGTFRQAAVFDSRIDAARLLDWDRDGKLDLVTPEAGQLTVLRGDGTGSFVFVASYGLGGSDFAPPYLLDTNADGQLDLVYANQYRSFVLEAAADGFGRSLLAAGIGSPRGIAILDGNGDGKLDLVAGAGQSALFPGDGRGGFGAAVLLPIPMSAASLAAHDMDEDGRDDLVTAHYLAGKISVVYGAPGGGFEPGPMLDAIGTKEHARLGDVDGDGRADIVVLNGWDRFAVSARFGVSLATGPRSFAVQRTYDTADYVMDALPLGRDATGHGTLAVLTWRPATGCNLVVYRNDTGSLVPASTYPVLLGARALASADLNADGRTDLVVGGSAVEILHGTATGVFERRPTLEAAGGAVQVEITDLDRDGDRDIVAATWRGTLLYWTRNAGGTYDAPIEYGVLTVADDLAAGDVNGDGRPDLFLMNWQCGIVDMLASFPGTTPVVDFALAASGSDVVVSWRLGPDDLAGLRRIEVLRASAAEGPFDVIAIFESLSPAMQYVDRMVAPGGEAWYAQALYDLGGEVSVTAARSLRLGSLASALHAPRYESSGTVAFRYDLGGRGADVRLTLFDVRGRVVETLARGWREAGRHEIVWRPGAGGGTARGVYFVRLHAGGFVADRRVVVLAPR